MTRASLHYSETIPSLPPISHGGARTNGSEPPHFESWLARSSPPAPPTAHPPSLSRQHSFIRIPSARHARAPPNVLARLFCLPVFCVTAAQRSGTETDTRQKRHQARQGTLASFRNVIRISWGARPREEARPQRSSRGPLTRPIRQPNMAVEQQSRRLLRTLNSRWIFDKVVSFLCSALLRKASAPRSPLDGAPKRLRRGRLFVW